MSRPLIEEWFPTLTVGAESLRERGASSALPPINFLHVWWARRPLTASRAAVVASLLPAWPSEAEAAADEHAAEILSALEAAFGNEDAYQTWFVRSLGILGDPVAGRARIKAANELGIKLSDNGYGYNRAFTVSPDNETVARVHQLAALRAAVSEPPVVVDPFAGGGSLPFEAARYGCDTVANELNPVAAAILEGTVALPAQLGPEFAKTIESWGAKWAKRVEQRLDPFFPRAENGESILGYIWAHTVPCPTTGLPTLLAPNFWLARDTGNDSAVALDVDRETGTICTSVVSGAAASEFGDRATYRRGSATSVWTGETFGGDYIGEQANAGRLGELLLAVAVTPPGTRGRQFRSPTKADLDAVTAAGTELARLLPGWEVADLIPSEAIFEGKETKRSVDMGLRYWRDMFSPRQLLTHGTGLEELRGIVAAARLELGDDQAKALGLYLSFAVSKALNYNARLSTWHSLRVSIANVFDRHDFAFKWSFGELDGAHALYPWAVSQVGDAYAGIAKLARRPASMLGGEHRAEARILLGSATDLPLEGASVDAVVTDPPYYDNVMYGECSDYFYVWLKRSLRDTWPELTTQPLSDKEAEAVANPSLFKDVATHSGRGKRREGTVTAAELADRHYETLLTRSFREAHRVLKPNGVMTVMFTHKRVDAWDTLGQALLEAGFAIHSSWPVHTESEHSLHQAKKNAAASTILLTCRKRATTDPAYWVEIRGDVERAAEDAATRFAEQGIIGVDLTLATYGPVLSVLSRRWPVYTGELDSDGNPEVLRPDVALDLAREKVATLKKRGLLSGRDVDFDRLTDWWLLAWNDFQAAEFPFDEARKLSLALHLDVEDLAARKLVKSSSGTVTLQTPAQRRTAGGLDPDAASFASEVDALHALMLVYEEEGMSAARAFLDRTGRGDNTRFEALVQAALHAVPRAKKADGSFFRTEATALEGIRQTLFPAIEPPAEPTPPAEQLVLETA
jgi:adenine-specific DNA methylase